MSLPLSFHTLNIQTALFLSTIDLTKKPDLAIAIRDASSGLIGGDPILLPIPDNAPSQFPRLIAKSMNERWVCQIKADRIDFHFNQKIAEIEDTPLDQITQEHIALTSDVWQAIQDQFRASACRIGFIMKQVSFVSDANSLLRDVFLHTSNFNASHELQVHALHKLSLNSYQVNRWTRFRAMPAPDNLDYENILQAEIDINTFPENKLDLSALQVEEFSSKALAMIDETMKQFWNNTD